jgi:cell pole-organizing protein PopZ
MVGSGGDRADAGPATAVEKTPPAETCGKKSDYIRPREAGEARSKAEVPSPLRPPEPAAHRQESDRQLLSPSAEAAVSASFAEVESAMARADPPAVEQLAETLMRPMVKAWLDENLPPLVERIVREEIERVARKR